jgi:hypothetical protein
LLGAQEVFSRFGHLFPFAGWVFMNAD